MLVGFSKLFCNAFFGLVGSFYSFRVNCTYLRMSNVMHGSTTGCSILSFGSSSRRFLDWVIAGRAMIRAKSFRRARASVFDEKFWGR